MENKKNKFLLITLIKKYFYYPFIIMTLTPLTAPAQNPYSMMDQANKLYEKGSYEKSIEMYEKIAQLDKNAPQPLFNKAVSLQKLGKTPEAIELYKKLAAEIEQNDLAAKIKYNLGNAFYQNAKQLEKQDTSKAIQLLKNAINNWRKALKMQPDNKNAAKNIELAKLEIQQMEKKIQQQKKQQNNQNNDPNQPQDKSKQNQTDNNQQQNQNKKQQQDQPSQDQQDQQKKQNPDSQPDNPQSRQEKQQSQKEKQPPQQLTKTARDILEKEKKDREKRQIIKFGHMPVEKDW